MPAPVNTAGMPNAVYGLFLSPLEITPRESWLLYNNVATFAKTVDLVADNVASLVPLFEIDGVQVEDDHPLHKFFKRPGFNRTRTRLIKELSTQHLVTGNGYLSVVGNPNYDPIALDVCKSIFVTNMQGPDMWPASFLYAEGTRHNFFTKEGQRDFRWLDQMNELVPIYAMDGYRRGVGVSKLNSIKADVELRLSGTEHNASMMQNGARPSGALSFKNSLTPEQVESVKSDLRSMSSGAPNAGKTMLFHGGESSFMEFSKSPKDMDWANLQKISDEAIIARYGVPITLYSTDAQTDNNYETAWNMFYDQAVLPEFNTIWSAIANNLSVRTGVEITVRHNTQTNNVLHKQSVGLATQLKGSNLVSTNEARLIIGKEPVIGGDVMYDSAANVPVGEDYFTDHMVPGETTHVALPTPATLALEHTPAKPEEKKPEQKRLKVVS